MTIDQILEKRIVDVHGWPEPLGDSPYLIFRWANGDIHLRIKIKNDAAKSKYKKWYGSADPDELLLEVNLKRLIKLCLDDPAGFEVEHNTDEVYLTWLKRQNRTELPRPDERFSLLHDWWYPEMIQDLIQAQEKILGKISEDEKQVIELEFIKEQCTYINNHIVEREKSLKKASPAYLIQTQPNEQKILANRAFLRWMKKKATILNLNNAIDLSSSDKSISGFFKVDLGYKVLERWINKYVVTESKVSLINLSYIYYKLVGVGYMHSYITHRAFLDGIQQEFDIPTEGIEQLRSEGISYHKDRHRDFNLLVQLASKQ